MCKYKIFTNTDYLPSNIFFYYIFLLQKEKPEQQAKAEKKKPESKKEALNGEVEKKEKKTISGGVAIEDIKVGNGPVAKPGKNVMVSISCFQSRDSL